MPPSVSRNKPFLSVLPGPLKSLHPKVYPETPLFHFEISSAFSTTHALSQTPWLDCTDPCPQLGALSPFLRAQGVYIPSGLKGRFLWSLSRLSHPRILSPPSRNPHPEALWLKWPPLVWRASCTDSSSSSSIPWPCLGLSSSPVPLEPGTCLGVESIPNLSNRESDVPTLSVCPQSQAQLFTSVTFVPWPKS